MTRSVRLLQQLLLLLFIARSPINLRVSIVWVMVPDESRGMRMSPVGPDALVKGRALTRNESHGCPIDHLVMRESIEFPPFSVDSGAVMGSDAAVMTGVSHVMVYGPAAAQNAASTVLRLQGR